MKYKVVTLNPTNDITASIQKHVDAATDIGYKYINHQYSEKLVPGTSGCFGLSNTPPSTVHVGFIIFGREE